MSHVRTHLMAVACALTGALVCAPNGYAQTAWTANGATACEKYLTPEVVAAILLQPAGHARRIDGQSCIYETGHAGSIGITLKVADINVFRLELPRIAYANPISGIGDAAYWNPGGGFSSVKGHDRGCDVAVILVPSDTKIQGEALARKVGDICNKLFAL